MQNSGKGDTNGRKGAKKRKNEGNKARMMERMRTNEKL